MLIALALLAADASTPGPGAPAPNKSDPVICRTPDSDVGTHMRPKPVCLKKSEWQLVERGTQNDLENLRERSNFDPGQNGGPR